MMATLNQEEDNENRPRQSFEALKPLRTVESNQFCNPGQRSYRDLDQKTKRSVDRDNSLNSLPERENNSNENLPSQNLFASQ